jgi:RNA polymerase sigma-70 factor, ECF subfamily
VQDTLLHLYESFRRQLCGTAARYVGNDAEDIVQEAFLSALRFGRAFRGEAEPLTWLHRIVINKSLDYHRKRARRDHAQLNLPDPPHPPGANRTRIATPPEEALTVRKALRHLTSREYRVFVMHDVLGYSHDEIARLLSIPMGTSKWRLGRARRRLQEQLADGGLVRTVRPRRRSTAFAPPC